MDAVLVNPNNRILSSFAGIEPPFWALMLATYLKGKGYSVEIIDAESDGLTASQTATKIKEAQAELVVIVVQGQNPSATSTPKMVATRELLISLGGCAKTVLVGIHPSALPTRTLLEEPCDYVARGEGFETIAGLLQHLDERNISGLSFRDDGLIVNNLVAPLLADLPSIDWTLVDLNKYRAHFWHCLDGSPRSPYATVFSSLGCAFRCDYCNIHELYNGTRSVRYRRIDALLNELEQLGRLGVRNIKLMDENFTVHKRRALFICQLITSLRLQFNIWCYGRVDSVNEVMLSQMKRAGINWIAYGFESGSDLILNASHKQANIQQAKAVAKMTHEAGINIIGNFIFGLPGDTKETMKASLAFAQELELEYVNFYVAKAYPGSLLYKRLCVDNGSNPMSWAAFDQYGAIKSAVEDFRNEAFVVFMAAPEYQDRIRCKFGTQAVEGINEMLRMGKPISEGTKSAVAK